MDDIDILISLLVKGYLRKGQALLGMKEFTRAQQAYQKVLEIDPNNAVCFIVECEKYSYCYLGS